MKLLATKIACLDMNCDTMGLSFDSEVCANSKNKEKIAQLFFDRYAKTYNIGVDDFYEPISADSLNSLRADFIPCVFAVAKDDEKDWRQSQQFYPNTKAYKTRLIKIVS